VSEDRARDPARCAFCAIVQGEADAAVVLDEDDVVAFLDVRPLFPGHMLVVPRGHVETLLKLAAHQRGTLFEAVQRVCRAVTQAMNAQGTFVAINNVVSQSVPHLHVHVVPRTKGDGLKGFFWPRHTYDTAEHMHAVAASIKAAL
jgi:histidine triad (HIT) family protein